MSTIRLTLLGDCAIDIDGSTVTPAAAHLFALLLLLTLERDRRLSRQELQRYLFAVDADARLASHNLRQLLYRLRQMGLHFDERPSGLRLEHVSIIGHLDTLRTLSSREGENIGRDLITFLPSYAPRLPHAFLEWLDRMRDQADGQIRKLLLAALNAFRASQAWAPTLRIGEILRDFDPFNEDVVSSRAEALAMLGRRHEALAFLDEYEKERSSDSDSPFSTRQLRARIAKLSAPKREGSLRGRESCLSFLHAEWAKLDSNGARQSALVGHAGIGKTRVADSFSSRISLLGGQVFRYVCDTQSRSQPLSLFSHILPELRRMRGSLGAAPEYKSALARLRPLDGATEASHPEGVSLEALRTEVQSAVIDLLEAVSSERCILLVIDDAHLLDDASCSVIRALTSTRNNAMLHVLLCLRPSHSHLSLLEPIRRGAVHYLEALPPEDSRELLLELVAGADHDESHIEWCLRQAAGNPFYLHTLAPQSSASRTSLPFDIRSLASSSYSSLSPSSRNVLESCLLLGRFATMDRVLRAAGVDEPCMLSALRELEERDLVQFAGGTLSGPHALLHDALRELIPSSVGAFLHRRIAGLLEEECVAEQYASSLAWASAQSWLAAGDPHAATRLMRRCASHAAALGEPTAATDLLSQVVGAQLPPLLQADLLDDLIRYAQAGGSQAIAASALRDRYRVAHDLAEGPSALKALELRIIEADLLDGGQLSTAIAPLMRLLADASIDTSLRVQAAVRLMIVADQELDGELAGRVNSWLEQLRPARSQAEWHFLRADLVFQTTFGDMAIAYQLASRLLASFPEPSIAEDSMRARNFAAYAFYRLRASDRAISICETSYIFMSTHRIFNQALYSASMRTEIAISDGDFEAASEWLAKAESAARGVAPHQLSPNSGLYPNAGILAMMEGRYDDAERLIFAPQRDLSRLSAARYKALSCAMSIRLKQLRANNEVTEHDVASLHDHYLKGCKLGGQDTIVEALWCARVLAGDPGGASKLLVEYLTHHRREQSTPDWSLRHTSAADDAWNAY